LGPEKAGKARFSNKCNIYGAGFDDSKRKRYATLVHLNLLRSCKALYDAARKLDVTIKDADCSAHLERLAEIDEKTFERLDDATAAALKSIWADPDIAALYLRRSEYYLPDSTGYFYNDIDRISAPGYNATEGDILHAREATTGIHEYTFDIKEKHALFRMIDVGGQRSERGSGFTVLRMSLRSFS